MLFHHKKGLYCLLFLFILLNGSFAFSALKPGHALIQLGGYFSSQGQAQHVNIQGLIGDQFTVTDSQSSNALVGLGYLVEGQERPVFKMDYGLNAFYLAKTGVTGNVIQENLFTNLSYHYNLTHYPVYFIAKSTLQTKLPQYALALDLGIGPNFMRADGFKEHSLDDGVTMPDRIFMSHTSTTFSATAGLSVKMNQVLGSAPLECGYRFFYLGQGRLNVANSQVINSLNTGSNYANALLCSIMI